MPAFTVAQKSDTPFNYYSIIPDELPNIR